MFLPFVKMQACDRQTDGQTDRRRSGYIVLFLTLGLYKNVINGCDKSHCYTYHYFTECIRRRGQVVWRVTAHACTRRPWSGLTLTLAICANPRRSRSWACTLAWTCSELALSNYTAGGGLNGGEMHRTRASMPGGFKWGEMYPGRPSSTVLLLLSFTINH